MMRILLLPLDERPCNIKFPRMIGISGGIDVVEPPYELLGDKKKPASTDDLSRFLKAHAVGCNAAVLSLDTLVYGGLIPSRLHHLSTVEATKRLNALRELKQENPVLTIYASMSIMRCPSYNSSDEEPDYYEDYGRSLFRRAYLTDKKGRGGLDDEERSELDSIIIPQEYIDDYEQRRATNLTVNEACLDLLKEGVIDFLVFPQDDSSPYGYTAIAQQRLYRAIAAKKIEGRVMMYPGSDEIGGTLLARAACHIKRCTPTVRPRYSSVAGPSIVPLYEDRPMFESLKSHILAAGCRLADPEEKADIELMINAPGRVMQEASNAIDGRDITYDSFRNLPEFAATTARLVKEGRRVAVCDSAYANGGDPMLISYLDNLGVMDKLAAYAGWNTNCNTLGTALAQAILGRQGSEATRANLAYRVIEDFIYQTSVRWQVDVELANHGGNYMDVRPCMDWAVDQVRLKLQASYERLALSHEIPVNITTVRFPWCRMFEIDMDLSNPAAQLTPQ